MSSQGTGLEDISMRDGAALPQSMVAPGGVVAAAGSRPDGLFAAKT